MSGEWNERKALPDGSFFLMEPIRPSYSVLISREVVGEVVWGQAFAHETEVLQRVVDDVRAGMKASPSSYLSAPRRGVYCSADRGCHPDCQMKGGHGW